MYLASYKFVIDKAGQDPWSWHSTITTHIRKRAMDTTRQARESAGALKPLTNLAELECEQVDQLGCTSPAASDHRHKTRRQIRQESLVIPTATTLTSDGEESAGSKQGR
jgi:hypothetical protein